MCLWAYPRAQAGESLSQFQMIPAKVVELNARQGTEANISSIQFISSSLLHSDTSLHPSGVSSTQLRATCARLGLGVATGSRCSENTSEVFSRVEQFEFYV